MKQIRQYISLLIEKELRGQKSKRTLYHIGPRPAEPKPKQRWQNQGQPEQEWDRPWLSSSVKSGVFLTPNPTDIVQHHGVSGNVYAYKVPEWVIEKSGGIHRFDTGSEILIPEEVWREAGKEIELLGKTMSQKDLWDTVGRSWSRDAKRKGTHSDSRDPSGDHPSLEGLRATAHPEAAVKMMSQEEIKKVLEKLATKYEVKPDEIITYPNARKGLRIPFWQKKPDKKDQQLLDLLRQHMNESVIRDYVRALLRESNEYGWEVSSKQNMKLDQEGMEKPSKDKIEKYLKSMHLMEDTATRKQLAKDLTAAGAKESKPVPSVETSREEHVQLVKDARSQGRLLKKAFAKNADRAFLDSLVTVHWFRNAQTMRQFIGGSFSSKDELSTAAYLPGEIKGAGRFGDYGILIKGHITLLANDMDQLYTGGTDAYDEVFPERKKQSGTNKGVQQIYDPEGYEEYKILVLDKEDWDPRFGGRGSSQNNEALVDNWSPMAIIVPDSSFTAQEWDENLQQLDPALPDTQEAEVWEELVEEAGLDIPVMTHTEFTKRGWV